MKIETEALMIGWNHAIPGREAAAGELFAVALAFYEKQQKAGKITSFEPEIIQAHGGDRNGYFFVKGTHANLDALQSDDEFVDLLMRMTSCLHGVSVNPCYVGKVIPDLMQRWAKSLPR